MEFHALEKVPLLLHRGVITNDKLALIQAVKQQANAWGNDDLGLCRQVRLTDFGQNEAKMHYKSWWGISLL